MKQFYSKEYDKCYRPQVHSEADVTLLTAPQPTAAFFCGVMVFGAFQPIGQFRQSERLTPAIQGLLNPPQSPAGVCGTAFALKR